MIHNKDIDRIASVSRDVAESRRDAQAAFADGVVAAQRRGMDVARDGLKFMEFQRESMVAARDWWFDGFKMMQLQQRNAEFVREWAQGAMDAAGAQAEENARVFETISASVRAQQESVRDLSNVWFGAYEGAVSSLTDYAREGVEAAKENAEQGVKLMETAADTTARVVENGGNRSALVLALENGEYDDMNVADVTGKLDGLSAEELKKVRAYEKRHKNRDSLVEQIDRKIKASS